MSQICEGPRTFTAGEALAVYRRVKLDSSGNVVYADAIDKSIGITERAAASGDPVAIRLHNQPGTRKVVVASSVVLGATLYGADDGKVNDVFAGTGERMGTALEAGTGDGSVVESLFLSKGNGGGVEVLACSIAQSSALGASSSAEATFSNGSVTIPAGEILEGDIFEIEAVGQHPTTNSSDTFTGRLYLGTEVIATTPNPDAVNGDVFKIKAQIVVRVASSSGKLVATGEVYNDALAAGLSTPFRLAEATEDVSVACDIKVTGQWSAAAANESRLEQFVVKRYRK